MWTSPSRGAFPSRRVLHVEAAQLDEDPLDELVVAWWSDQEEIVVSVWEWDPVTGAPSRLAADTLPAFPTTLGKSAIFALTAGDFDGDLVDTIAVVAPHQTMPPVQADDFDDFKVHFFDLFRDSAACGSAPRCLV